MKQIQEYNNDTETWEPLGRAFTGLSDEDAKKEIAQLRKWAKKDKSGKRYRAVDGTIVPV